MAETEPVQLFEKRKRDHLRIAMDPRVQAEGFAGFDLVTLIPEALPDLDFSEIQLSTQILQQKCSTPLFISSMTAGNEQGELINCRLAKLSQDQKILMGVGSQRRELSDPEAVLEWRRIRQQAPHALLVGNIGIAQLITCSVSQVQKLVDNLGACGLFVHLNPLQECLQVEGTPQFKGGLRAVESLVKSLSVPVIIKETGCGIAPLTLLKLADVGVQIVDVSGLGGTHWGRIEGQRSLTQSPHAMAADVFRNWGLSTVDALFSGQKVLSEKESPLKLWASGGVRSGLDVAKSLALGAQAVGVAQPFLKAALLSEEAPFELLERFDYELKTAMFCTGIGTVKDFHQKKVWQWT